MSDSLRRGRRRRTPEVLQQMTLGDVLYRLALIAPQDYDAIEVLARDALKRRWPIDDDVLLLDGPKTH